MAISKMTKKEAIAQLKMDRDLCNFNPMTGEEEPMNEDCRKSAEALDIAIKALEQEPCEDMVSRAEAKELAWGLCLETCYDNEKVIEMLDDLPSVTPAPKKGKWVPHKAKYDNVAPVYECSICHKYNGFEDTNYCPNCGCKMRRKRL